MASAQVVEGQATSFRDRARSEDSSFSAMPRPPCQSDTSFSSTLRPALAGMLEKCSRWRKDWEYRFCVLRCDRIDYYISAPADIDDEVPRGSIPLHGAAATEDIGRPFCIRVGGVLLSCSSEAEQRRWLETVHAAAVASGVLMPSTPSTSSLPSFQQVSAQDGPSSSSRLSSFGSTGGTGTTVDVWADARLLLLSPGPQPRELYFRRAATIRLHPSRGSAADTSAASLLIVAPTTSAASGAGGGTGCSAGGSSGSAQAVCHLPLAAASAAIASGADALLPLQPLSAMLPSFGADAFAEPQALRVRVISSKRIGAATSAQSATLGSMGVAFALLMAGSFMAGALAALITIILVLMDMRRDTSGAPEHEVTFSPERIERIDPRKSGGGAAASQSRRQAAITSAAIGSPEPLISTGSSKYLWVGKWKLDKSCSDPMDAVLADMGVNFILRKAADAKTSILTLSVTSAHVIINVKTLVTVEDTVPLDGSFSTKPAPPGGRVKGDMRVRVAKISERDLVLLTLLPQNEGEVRDILYMHEDNQSFTRRVERNGIIANRVFRKM